MTAKYHPLLLTVVRLLTGILFIFSGFIKANDPLGFSYKLEEYFNVFGLLFLHPFSVALAVVICAVEIILGAFLLLGLWRKLTAWGLLLLILFFTFLTFYSAYFDVVKTCGCFGDAIPLSPWQSFSKDLILLVLIGIIFYYRKRIQSITGDRYTQGLITAAIVVVSLGIGIYTYNFLPFFDFLPYKKGNNLPELMKIPEGAVLDSYETLYHLKHKETGEEKSMTDKQYLATEIWKDDNWEIIGTPETRLLKAGYRPPIPDLLISDADGTDQTQTLLANPDYYFLIVAYDFDHTHKEALQKMNELALQAEQEYHMRSVLLTSSAPEKALALADELDLQLEVLYADAVPLKSMVRANPGLMLMKQGVVVNKWHFHVAPSWNKLVRQYFDPA